MNKQDHPFESAAPSGQVDPPTLENVVTDAQDRETILISRYSSRRLYNTHTSAYVTLDEIAGLINQGYDIRVVDKKSGEDITRQILLQIITEHEARGDNVLPLNVLTDIIRSYSDQAQTFLPDFLAASFAAFKEQQDEIIGAMQKQWGNPLDPQNAMANIEAWQQTQAEMMKGFMDAWMPQQNSATTEPPHNPSAAPAHDPRDSELEAMKEQLRQLQEQIKNM